MQYNMSLSQVFKCSKNRIKHEKNTKTHLTVNILTTMISIINNVRPIVYVPNDLHFRLGNTRRSRYFDGGLNRDDLLIAYVIDI